MIKVVIFDVGGVLHQHNADLVYDDLASYFAIDRSLVVAQYHKLIPLLGSGRITEAEFWQQFQTNLGLSKPLPKQSLLVHALAATLKMNTPLYTYIAKLRSPKLKVAILSNTIRPHADFLRAQGVYDGFDTVILSHEVGLRKPDPQIYTLTVKNSGYRPTKLS